MKRAGTFIWLTLAGVAAMAQQQDRELIENAVYRHTAPKPGPVLGGRTLNWNPTHVVLFKGSIAGILESAPMADGKSWLSLLVKLKNGGTALVELGPKDYVDAQGLRLRMKAPLWVAGSKSWTEGGDSVILAQRLNFDGFRPAFRAPDGKPFWK